MDSEGFILTKLLPLAVYPLGLAILLGLLATTFSFTRRRGLMRATVITAVACVWLPSTAVVSDWAIGTLESQFPSVPLGDIQPADVVVVLGGALAGPGPYGISDASEAIDRVLVAARLYHSGRAPTILVSGGNVPWEQGTSEAILVRDFLVDLGVSTGDILLEGDSRNTRENAVNSAQLSRQYGWGEILLVTSAFHMPRAVASFEAVGIQVQAVPTDYRGLRSSNHTVLDFLPDVQALSRTTIAVKEWLGLLAYSFRGWI